MKKNVLIFNQSSELYGSDKALLELLENFPMDYNPIVVLEHEGPLKEILLSKGIQVIKAPVMKLTRKRMSLTGMLGLGADMISGLIRLRRATRKMDITLVHSNSIAVFMGGFYAFFFRKKHLWHVHEIVEHPKVVANAYPRFVSMLADRIVFNSRATYDNFFRRIPSVEKKSTIVHNGVRRGIPATSPDQIAKIRGEKFKSVEGDIVIGLIGRISRLKGQLLLLESFSELCKKHANVRLVYIGSTPPGQNHFGENLSKRIEELNLTDKVSVLDFKSNLWPYYDAMDIVVVPSTEPESFGLVAAEAMLSLRPVIGSGFGGLTEVIEDGKTGFLFAPGNASDLTTKLEMLISNPALREQFGREGKARTTQLFSPEKYHKGMADAYQKTLNH
jgi:glycosyltransferase involved in cell wall biosynthesis